MISIERSSEVMCIKLKVQCHISAAAPSRDQREGSSIRNLGHW